MASLVRFCLLNRRLFLLNKGCRTLFNFANDHILTTYCKTYIHGNTEFYRGKFRYFIIQILFF